MAVKICQLPGLEEIRLRRERPIRVFAGGKEYMITDTGKITYACESAHKMSGQELEGILTFLCRQSLYAYEEEMRQGFITIKGGHRVGIAGQVILEQGRLKNIRYITGMNIRISHAYQGVSDGILKYLYEGGEPVSTLLISPPGCGKTTLLRDLIRQISDGNPWGQGRNVGVIDERSELAGGYLGAAYHDLGSRTDVMDRCPKSRGMMMLIRSMNPAVLAVDELGGDEDLIALRQALYCGCKILATIHGTDLTEALRKNIIREMQKENAFHRFVLLRKQGGKFCSQVYDETLTLLEKTGKENV